jgi:hypothetical protein
MSTQARVVDFDYYTSTYGSLDTIDDAIDAVQEVIAHQGYLGGSSGHHYMPESTFDRQTRRSNLVRPVYAPESEALDA